VVLVTGSEPRQAAAAGLQFGGVWTVIIVVQIAFTTLLPWPLLGLGGDFGEKRQVHTFPGRSLSHGHA